ncbi:sigma-54 interaction domain-containing protein [Sporomusa acidovorans]|uniref:Anaerobic nitric oxide reductase transcription regulator NorR n=1 Tax=Sporomusa acidovorans (strain ATCC 49682 / DSM 3132 / Mol) TaxID=1123286 RepID=A0ABZ3J7E5_SPOA4|nr:sigma 54-interacting transcriptional regulator [Sporomusa acidovorans]OZC18563.1 propionate catabolism operon regulatory protein [Sporomusa acidovorans DSM 3132]SDE38414.1 Transcriptional regulator containing PAS, AAA-type ATPase, and DNA-binding Fis domains [Sporomusa acidovorans]
MNSVLETSSEFQELMSFMHLQPQQLDEITKYKERLINFNELPQDNTLIRKEIASSWLRSQQRGILPKTSLREKLLKPSQFKKVLKDNQLLLHVAEPIITQGLRFISKNSPYTFGLTDRNGILLSVHNPCVAQLKTPGIDISEEAVGTAAHSLSAALGKPVCTVGPETYNYVLQKGNVVISVPIHDAKDNVAAVFTIPYYRKYKHTKEEEALFTWLIAWQFSTARKIEEALAQASHKFHTAVQCSILDSALSMVNDGLLFIDHRGEISYISQGGEQLLGLNSDIIKGRHYSELLGHFSQVSGVLHGKISTANVAATINGVNGNKQCVLKVEPLLIDQNDIAGAIIRVCSIKQTSITNEKTEGFSAVHTFKDILGENPKIIKAKQLANKIAYSDLSVLLIGDTGTGKELFAQAIHNEALPEKPFVAINCASIPQNLIESELFGYEGGTFTGADKNGRIGKVEMANGGTLFLDEIGDMPLDLQAVLLRVLEDKRVLRIGGNKYIPVNFRVIAATNKRVYEMVQQRTFREDLYYRLATCKIEIPSLQQRSTDIIPLAQFFIKQQCFRLKLPICDVDPAVWRKITQYEWPGNIRQLKSAMFLAVNIAQNGVIQLCDLPDEVVGFSDSSSKYGRFKPLSELEKNAIMDVMAYTDNDLIKASKILGLSRSTLYRRLRAYNFPLKDTN